MKRLVKKNSIIRVITMLLISSFVWSIPALAKEPDWFLKLQRIKIFESTKQEVESEFDHPKVIYWSRSGGRPANSWGESIEYQTKDGKLDVYYSTGRCSELTGKKGWDVSEGIVISIKFEPDKPVKLSELNLDLRTFVAYKESDNPTYNYRSSELGIEFSTLGGEVTSFEYSLTPEMKKLDCERVLKKKS